MPTNVASQQDSINELAWPFRNRAPLQNR